MTPAQVERASELLCDRQEIASRLKEMSAAKSVRIEYRRAAKNDLDDQSHRDWSRGPEMGMNPTIRRMLCSGIEEELDAIDKELIALGVDIGPLKEEAA